MGHWPESDRLTGPGSAADRWISGPDWCRWASGWQFGLHSALWLGRWFCSGAAGIRIFGDASKRRVPARISVYSSCGSLPIRPVVTAEEPRHSQDYRKHGESLCLR
jgi:hypothetical protein